MHLLISDCAGNTENMTKTVAKEVALTCIHTRWEKEKEKEEEGKKAQDEAMNCFVFFPKL